MPLRAHRPRTVPALTTAASTLIGLLVSTSTLGAPAHAADPEPVRLTAAEGLKTLRKAGAERMTTFERVRSSDGGLAAIRMSAVAAPETAYRARLVTGMIRQALAPGDTVRVSLEIRATDNAPGAIPVYLQQTAPEWRSLASGFLQPGTDWEQITLDFPITEHVEGNTLNIAMHLGQKAQAFEIRAFALTGSGPDLEPIAPAPARAFRAPDQIRIADGYLAAVAPELAEGFSPETIQPLMDFDDDGVLTLADKGRGVTGETFQPAGVPFGEALRVSVPRRLDKPWFAEVSSPASSRPIFANDLVYVSYYLRAPHTMDESGQGRMRLFFAQNEPDWRAVGGDMVDAGPEWKRVHHVMRANHDFDAGYPFLSFHMGFAEQVLEIGGLVAVNLGPDADPSGLPQNRIDYPGRSADAPWRSAAEQRIRTHRMSPVALTLRDGEGKAVAGRELRVRLVEHAFIFGNFLGAVEEGADHDEPYLALNDRLFNGFATAYYWEEWGWLVPHVKDAYLESLERLQAYDDKFLAVGQLMRPGAYPSPAYLEKFVEQPAKLRSEMIGAVREALEETKRFRIDEWAVVNEAVNQGDYLPIVGRDIMVEAFELCRDIQPDAKRLLNETAVLSGGGDGKNRAGYHDLIRYLLDADAPVQAIGLQGHFGSDLTDPARVYDILDEFAAYGLPLCITEFDVDINDESAKADYVRDFYTVVFSHPAVTTLFTWDIWAGSHWKEKAAWYTRDFEPLPAAGAFEALVHDRWKTDVVVTTGADGALRLDGFHGRYEVLDGDRVIGTFHHTADAPATGALKVTE